MSTDTITREDTREGIARMLRAYGTTSDETWDALDALLDTMDDEESSEGAVETVNAIISPAVLGPDGYDVVVVGPGAVRPARRTPDLATAFPGGVYVGNPVDDGRAPEKADRWFAQVGPVGTVPHYVAVAPWEDEAEWFDGVPRAALAAFTAPRVLPVAEPPTNVFLALGLDPAAEVPAGTVGLFADRD